MEGESEPVRPQRKETISKASTSSVGISPPTIAKSICPLATLHAVRRGRVNVKLYRYIRVLLAKHPDHPGQQIRPRCLRSAHDQSTALQIFASLPELDKFPGKAIKFSRRNSAAGVRLRSVEPAAPPGQTVARPIVSLSFCTCKLTAGCDT
jgi:hypothetical protein